MQKTLNSFHSFMRRDGSVRISVQGLGLLQLDDYIIFPYSIIMFEYPFSTLVFPQSLSIKGLASNMEHMLCRAVPRLFLRPTPFDQSVP